MKFISINKIILSILLISVMPFASKAQYYVIEQDPASVKWKQINSENFQLIFPENYESNALEYINLLEFSKEAVSSPYHPRDRKFKIVLHNKTTTSNAMVSPTPMHAIFYEIPDQHTYAQRWNKQLVLHEYRHAVQIMKMNQAFTRVLYFALGDQALAAIFGIFTPLWFIEGDGVYSETINSRSGRGRSPDFSMDLKAQLLDKKIYSYDKAYFGSYKNYTPDHYTLGYQIVLNGNAKYGPEIWNKTLDKVARRPFTMMPFSSSIKKYFGKGKVAFYKSTMESIKDEWMVSDSAKSNNGDFISQPDPKDFTDYKFPFKINDNKVVALKTGIDDIPRFVEIDNNGNEKTLFTPGYSFNESLSANDSLICWNEKSYDPRWGMRNYSIIKIRNYITSKTDIISRRSRLFAPQLSHDATKICAVEVSEENIYTIVIIDIKTKEIIDNLGTTDNLFLIRPQWSENDKSIECIGLGDKGKAIVSFDLVDRRVNFLSKFTFLDINYVSRNANKIIYTAPYGETNNIYLQDLETNNTYKLTDTRFDAASLSFSKDGEEIYFSEYTSDGYRLSSISSTALETQKVEISNLSTSFAIDKYVNPSNFVLDDSIVVEKDYPVKKYSKAGHLFNLHSWAPVGIDLDNYTVTPGVTLLSQNLLSSSVSTLGYYYDINEQTGKIKFNYDYYGWYPVIKIGVEYGGRRQYHYNDSLQQNDEIRSTETDINAGFSLPLTFTRSKWLWGIQPYVGISQKFLKMHPDSKYSFNTDRFTSLTYQFYIYDQLRRSARDIFPKWGQSLNFIYRHTPFGQENNTQLFSSFIAYLPGIINHHGIKLYGAYQKTERVNYPYSNLFSTARGYSNLSFDEVLSFKGDYALPIIYPDLSIPSVLYLKRIYGHVFYDYMYDLDPTARQIYSSTGLELYTDWHFLGTPLIVTLGGRASYKIEDSSTVFEFLFGLGY